MAITPHRPEHADKVTNIPGAPGFQTKRILEGYAYPQHGNLHNPTPRYRYLLLLDGRVVDQAETRRALVNAARQPNALTRYSE